MISVNQLATSIKLVECWKSINQENYRIKLEENNINSVSTEQSVSPSTHRKWNEDARTTAASESFSRNGAKLWNVAPDAIKSARKIAEAKRLINAFCNSLPF